jgi:superfamily II DNA/RNA helicase
LLERRFDKRRWPRVLFHGGVPGPQRGGLVHRFREDPDCRLFLSTDAGGVGLNLQCASVVVNVDQPWNPAIVEQRIGRVHRLGQRRPVSVINYVAQGTIEHGMLSLIKFKRSLFAGVLDGGESEVFLGGTRLNRFMESVETATGSVPPAMPASEPEAVERREASGGDGAVREIGAGGESPTSAREAAWSELAVAGMAFVEKLGRALSTSESGAGAAASLLERDERTGRAYLKIPAPEPEVLLKFAEMLGRLAGSRAEE